MIGHFRILAGAIIFFLLITAQSLFFLSRFQLRFELAVPICLMLDMFLLLFSGLLVSNLLIGIYLIFALSVAGIFAVIIKEKACLLEFCRVFSSLGFVVFVIGYALCWAVSLPHVTYEWDDFGHWLPFVEQMVSYDKLYSLPEIYLIRHWYYTPAMPLLQYLACKLAGGYTAGVCFAVSTLVIFTAFLPLIKWINLQSRALNIIAVFVVFFTIHIIAHDSLNGYFIGFGTAYVDIQLSVVCALLLLWSYCEEDSISKVVYLSIIASFLSLIKLTGIMFSLLGIGTYILMEIEDWIYKSYKSKKFNLNLKTVCIYLIPVIAIVAVWLLWSAHSYPDIGYGSMINIDFTQVTHRVYKYGQGLTLRSVPIMGEWLRTYFYHFFVTNINETAIFPITTSPILLTFLFILFLKIRVNKKTDGKLCVLGLCVTGGLFVYLMALGILFYSYEENLDIMTSYQRYLSSYVGIIIILTFVFGLQVFFSDILLTSKIRRLIFTGIIILLILLIPKDIIPAILGNAYSTTDLSKENDAEYERMRVWGKNVCTTVQSCSGEESSLFLIMDSHTFPDTPSLNGEVAAVSYFTLPIELQRFGQLRYDPDPSLPFYTAKEWGEILLNEGFSHVLLANFSSDSIIWWKTTETKNISKMYSLFDIPPEELSYDAPLLFQVYTDCNGQARLRPVLVETPIR